MQAVLSLLTNLIEEILISLLNDTFQLFLIIDFRLFLQYLGNSLELSVLDGFKYFI